MCVEDAKARVAHESQLPKGTCLCWGGQYEHYQEARHRLCIAVPVCFLLILILLYTTFGNLRDAALVLTAVPLSVLKRQDRRSHCPWFRTTE